MSYLNVPYFTRYIFSFLNVYDLFYYQLTNEYNYYFNTEINQPWKHLLVKRVEKKLLANKCSIDIVPSYFQTTFNINLSSTQQQQRINWKFLFFYDISNSSQVFWRDTEIETKNLQIPNSSANISDLFKNYPNIYKPINHILYQVYSSYPSSLHIEKFIIIKIKMLLHHLNLQSRIKLLDISEKTTVKFNGNSYEKSRKNSKEIIELQLHFQYKFNTCEI